MKNLFLGLSLLLSTVLSAAEPIRVHWPLMSYLALVKARAAEQARPSGGQAGMAFPMLLVFSSSGELKWLGPPDALGLDQLDLEAASAAAGNELAAVMATLDMTRKNIPDAGFEQVLGNPSEHITADRATAILVMGNFNCEGCGATMEKSIAAIPEDWNRIVATVTLSK
jgi:hypothetical protein